MIDESLCNPNIPENPPESIIVEQKESVKLIRNTKGYNWEIKLLEINLDRLKEIDDRLKKDYGQK